MTKLFSSFTALLLTYFLSVNPYLANAQKEKSDDFVANWRADLSYLAFNMEKVHKNLFHTISKEEFNKAVDDLNGKIPYLKRHEIIVAMMHLEAMIGDGHTNINPARDARIDFQTLPVKFYLFEDGVFIRSAEEKYKRLVGKQVISINTTTIEDAINKVFTITSRDNESGARFFATIYLSMPEVLHALGIIEDLNLTTLTIKNENGKPEKIALSPLGKTDILKGEMDLSWQTKPGWVDMREISKRPTPLWLQAKPGNKYWLQYLPDPKIVYVQLNEIGTKEKGEEQIDDFYARVFKFADSVQAAKLIFDLRLNGGGNGFYNKSLLIRLIKSRMDEKGKVFCITGRRTFSAAQLLINLLAQYTNVLLVGEPSGSKLNSYGDSQKIILPISGITARVSTLWHQSGHPKDTESFIPVDIPAPLLSKDYANNVDPALETVINYSLKN